MSEETRRETMETVTEPEITAAAEPTAEEVVAAEPETVTEETMATGPEMAESMNDYADELEASFKEFDEKCSRAYVEDEPPDAEKWQELRQMLDERTIIKIKVKEIVKDGTIAYVDETKAFIPVSQLSLSYVENSKEFVDQYPEVHVIITDPEAKRLVLPARDILKECQGTEKSKAFESYKADDTMEGTVDSIEPYGAFVNLDGGVLELLHISQISTQRIEHPSVALKEGRETKVKALFVANDKTSLSMRVLEKARTEADEHIDFDYKSDGAISTGLENLLKGLKL